MHFCHWQANLFDSWLWSTTKNVAAIKSMEWSCIICLVDLLSHWTAGLFTFKPFHSLIEYTYSANIIVKQHLKWVPVWSSSSKHIWWTRRCSDWHQFHWAYSCGLLKYKVTKPKKNQLICWELKIILNH